MVAYISDQLFEVRDVKESGCLGGAIAGAAASGVYASCAEARATRRPVGTTVQPDALAAPSYRAKYAAYRQFSEHLGNPPVQL
jgi:L-xylulokinase